jgi:hypothetical protein
MPVYRNLFGGDHPPRATAHVYQTQHIDPQTRAGKKKKWSMNIIKKRKRNMLHLKSFFSWLLATFGTARSSHAARASGSGSPPSVSETVRREPNASGKDDDCFFSASWK